jgi:hypothetical protein
LCWTTPPGEDGDEIQSMRRPANVCYEPFRETGTLDKFCLHPCPSSGSVPLSEWRRRTSPMPCDSNDCPRWPLR